MIALWVLIWHSFLFEVIHVVGSPTFPGLGSRWFLFRIALEGYTLYYSREEMQNRLCPDFFL